MSPATVLAVAAASAVTEIAATEIAATAVGVAAVRRPARAPRPRALWVATFAIRARPALVAALTVRGGPALVASLAAGGTALVTALAVPPRSTLVATLTAGTGPALIAVLAIPARPALIATIAAGGTTPVTAFPILSPGSAIVIPGDIAGGPVSGAAAAAITEGACGRPTRRSPSRTTEPAVAPGTAGIAARLTPVSATRVTVIIPSGPPLAARAATRPCAVPRAIAVAPASGSATVGTIPIRATSRTGCALATASAGPARSSAGPAVRTAATGILVPTATARASGASGSVPASSVPASSAAAGAAGAARTRGAIVAPARWPTSTAVSATAGTTASATGAAALRRVVVFGHCDRPPERFACKTK